MTTEQQSPEKARPIGEVVSNDLLHYPAPVTATSKIIKLAARPTPAGRSKGTVTDIDTHHVIQVKDQVFKGTFTESIHKTDAEGEDYAKLIGKPKMDPQTTIGIVLEMLVNQESVELEEANLKYAKVVWEKTRKLFLKGRLSGGMTAASLSLGAWTMAERSKLVGGLIIATGIGHSVGSAIFSIMQRDEGSSYAEQLPIQEEATRARKAQQRFDLIAGVEVIDPEQKTVQQD